MVSADDSWVFTSDGKLNDNLAVLVKHAYYDEDEGDCWYLYALRNTNWSKAYQWTNLQALSNFGVSRSKVESPYFDNASLSNSYGISATYNTIKVFEAPYSGYFRVSCNAPKGQDSRTNCWQSQGGWGSYGSYIHGEVYLDKGERLIMIMGRSGSSGNAPMDGDCYDEDEPTWEAISRGEAGASIYVFKYKDSKNLMSYWNECQPGRQYTDETLLVQYYNYRNGYTEDRLYLPNCELLMICGGGNGGISRCCKDGTDYDYSGAKSGFYYNEGLVRHFVGVSGKHSVLTHTWSDTTTTAYGYRVNYNGNTLKYEGYYKGSNGVEVPVSGDVYGTGGNATNDSWVRIDSIGYYVHYKPNCPEGVDYSGVMYSDRVGTSDRVTLQLNKYVLDSQKYRFLGWATTKDKADALEVDYLDGAEIGILSGDLIMYAVWQPGYSIVYNSNEPMGRTATGVMPSRFIEFGQNVTLDKNVYELVGYQFEGWSTTKDGDVDYGDEALIESRVDDLILYAVWEGNKYNVNVMSNTPIDSTSVLFYIK